MIKTCPFNFSGSKSNYFNLHEINVPFVDLFGGGGGIRSNVKSNDIIVNDIITPLIQFQELIYKSSYTELNSIINDLFKITSKIESKEQYNSLRETFNTTNCPIVFMCLLSTCTNNMIRFNSNFKFNQTWGKRKFNSSMENKLRNFHSRIKHKNIIFYNESYETINHPEYLYFVDPPYLISAAGYNTSWSENKEKTLYNYLINKNFILTNFLKKSNIFNNILFSSIIENNWKFKILKTGKMKAQKNKNDIFEEIIVSNSNEILNSILVKIDDSS